MKKIFTSLAVAAAATFCIQAAAPADALRIRMGAPQVSDEIIDFPPEGELTWLDRSCEGFNYSAYMATHSEVLGSVVQMVEGEDGYVYLNHMASWYPVDTWNRFKREGNTLVMEGVQAIYEEYDEYYDEFFTVYLAPMEVKVDENNVGTFVVNDDCRYVFNIGEDGSLTAADPKMLLGVCVHTIDDELEGNDVWIWKGFGDYDIKMVPANGEPVYPPAEAKIEYWVMTDEYVHDFVQVVIDGDDFYVCGLDSSIPDAWVKGQIADGKVTFPSGQYLGADMEIFHYSYFCGAEFFDEEDEDGVPFRSCRYADSAVFSYDEVNHRLTTERGYIINSTAKDLYPLYFYEDVTIEIQHRNPEAIPEAPVIFDFYSDDWGDRVWFDLPNIDVEGNLLIPTNLFYEVYVNGELQYYDIVDEDWNVENTSRIPYEYDDWEDFWVAGTDHTAYVHYDAGEIYSVGVRSIYVNENGEDIFSETSFWGETVGVNSVASDIKPVSVRIYDLQGRRIDASAKGIVVKVTEYSDGTVSRCKQVNK